MFSLEQILQLASVFGMAGAAFYTCAIRPLQKAIDELKDELKAGREERLALVERIHMLEIGLAENKQSTRSAHHRIDELLEAAHEKN